MSSSALSSVLGPAGIPARIGFGDGPSGLAGLFASLLGGEMPKSALAAAGPLLSQNDVPPAVTQQASGAHPLAKLIALLDGGSVGDTDAQLAELDVIAGLFDLQLPLETIRAELGDGIDLARRLGLGGGAPADAGALAGALRDLADQLAGLAPDLSTHLLRLAGQLTTEPTDPALLTRLGLTARPAGDALAQTAAAEQHFNRTTLTPPLSAAVAEPQDDGPAGARNSDPLERAPVGGAAERRDARASLPTSGAAPTSAPQPPPDPLLAALPQSGALRFDPATAAALRPAGAPYPSALAQVAVPQLAFEIARQVQGGNSRFQIRLDPPELGRIDVKLDFDGAGTLHARLSVDRAETLDLLQRDQRTLERALAQAGLDGQKTSLEFSLRQNPSGREGGHQGHDPAPPQNHPGLVKAGADEAPTITLYRGAATAGGVNLLA